MPSFIESRPADAITPLLVDLRLRIEAVESFLIDEKGRRIARAALQRRAARIERERGAAIRRAIIDHLDGPDEPGFVRARRPRVTRDR
jgi:hypothetical protein